MQTQDQQLVRICKRFTFEAAHQLPWHDGKCARPHGHSYVLEVEVEGPVQPNDGRATSGMVIDFGQLKSVVKTYVDLMDHYSLNQMLQNPTAENLVLWLAPQLAHDVELLYPGVRLSRVRLHETGTSWVEVTR